MNSTIAENSGHQGALSLYLDAEVTHRIDNSTIVRNAGSESAGILQSG